MKVTLLVTAICIVTGASVGAQQPPQKPAPPEETVSLANGWGLLRSGEAAKAAIVAETILAKSPQSAAAGALLIDSTIALGGGLNGLSAYERWLSSRRLEDGYLLRRVARAVLWGASTSAEVGVEALQHLADDGDVEARALLAKRMVQGGLAEMRALARIGDEGAVRRIIDLMGKQQGSKRVFIDALIYSRNPLAIPALTTVLDDRNRPEDIAAAADGLGTLQGKVAIPKLQQLYADQSLPGFVPFLAAGALYRMNDVTGISLLQRQLTSEVPQLRIGAAEQMANQPDATWLQVVRGLIGDRDPVVRLRAAKLLAAYDLEQSRQSLEGLARDENPAVREMANQVIIERTASDFGTLRRLLRSGDPLTQVRSAGRILELAR